MASNNLRYSYRAYMLIGLTWIENRNNYLWTNHSQGQEAARCKEDWCVGCLVDSNSCQTFCFTVSQVCTTLFNVFSVPLHGFMVFDTNKPMKYKEKKMSSLSHANYYCANQSLITRIYMGGGCYKLHCHKNLAH
jgi:hypothetical protein